MLVVCKQHFARVRDLNILADVISKIAYIRENYIENVVNSAACSLATQIQEFQTKVGCWGSERGAVG